ncbi:MAG: alkaline phosphatase PhoX, partial [Myxococcota bacterium]
EVFQVAAAPCGAELTGPKFSPDGQTLFLSVQHPGEHTEMKGQWASHWPHGGSEKPAPAVVTIQGPALDALTQGG